MPQSNSNPDPDVRAFADALYQAAQSLADTYGRTFNPDAGDALRGIAQNAAAETFSPHRAGEAALSLDERKAIALEAMQALVKAMNSHAHAIANYAPDRLGEQTLAGAMSGLCPCWPIC